MARDRKRVGVQGDVSSTLAGARCLVVEDEPVVLQALRRLLQRSNMLVSVADDVAEGLRVLGAERPEVVITDLGFEIGSGEVIVHAARTLVPRPGVVVLSGLLDALLPITLRGQGAFVIDKSRGSGALLVTVAAALAERRDPMSDLARRLLSAVPPCTVLEEAVLLFARRFRLSPRQAEALRMVTTHLDNEAIAIEMGVEESTLRVHLARIAEKVGLVCDAGTREALLRELLIFCAGRREFP
jgi:DNA-binding NarL/FixJ family response regulator